MLGIEMVLLCFVLMQCTTVARYSSALSSMVDRVTPAIRRDSDGPGSMVTARNLGNTIA